MNVHVPYTQAGRMMAITTPLGADTLLLEHLAIDEGINSLFTIEAHVKSQRDDLKASDLIGASVDVRLQLKDDGTRWWNGFVTALREGPLTSRGTRSYSLVLRPKLWTLSRKSDCRIFLDQTSIQVAETLCKEHGITDLALRITGQPPARDYSLQWNETDLAYMLRRLQQDGIFFWHEQTQGKHTLVLADHVSGYRDSPQPQVRYAEGSADQDHVTTWHRTFAFIPGKRSGRDWNFQTMQAPEGGQTTIDPLPGDAQEELYEFPGLFEDTSGAEQAMKYRIQASETDYETVEATSTVRTLGPGQRFTPHDVSKPQDVFAPQVLTTIRHVAVDRTYESNGGQPSYDNSFAAMPATTPATPHRTIPRPMITGSQIALIAGPEGEEIFTDSFARVKVWFPWDRRARKDGSDTKWIRVGQPWAGTTWGHQVIPRIGMEAVVSYREGDPDKPFVLALLPDPTNPVPYTLPDNKTRMVVRSKSYKSTGNNEMTFEDATGAENQFFNASKDQTTHVTNNVTRSIGANQSVSIGQNRSTTIGQNATTEVAGSMNVTVGGTGAGAAAMMAPLLGMTGITSGMLGQALAVAGGSGAAAASGVSGALSGALGGLANVANPASGAAGGLTSSGVSGAVGSMAGMATSLAGAASGLGGLMSSAVGMVPGIAGGALGVLSSAGQSAQSAVVSPSNPLADAGTALASSGASLGSAVASLFGMSGMLNVSVANTRTDSIGIAHAMQVGMSQSVNIGQTKTETIGQAHTHTVGQQMIVNVGQQMQLNVGQIFQIIVGGGAATLTMDNKGNVSITGKTFTTTFSGQVNHYGLVINHNP